LANCPLISVIEYRLAWCAVERRVRPGEARRTGRARVAGRSRVDPLNRRDQRRKYRDDHRDTEKDDGGTVAIRLVAHEGASTPEWKRHAACKVPGRNWSGEVMNHITRPRSAEN
jgi:hypothetical protein